MDEINTNDNDFNSKRTFLTLFVLVEIWALKKWSHKNPLLKDKPTKWNTLYFCLCGGLKVNNKRAFYILFVLEERWALKKCPHKNPILKCKNTNFVVQSKKHYTCVYVAGCGPKVDRKQSRNSISASTTSTQLMWHLISPLPQRLFWSTINLLVKK